MHHRLKYPQLLIASSILFFTLSLIPIGVAHSQSAQALKNTEKEIRENMITISRQLGVTCTECHNPSDFRDEAKPNFKVGKEHMKIVDVLRDKGFDGKRGPEASCFMCHKGQLKFDFKEPEKKH